MEMKKTTSMRMVIDEHCWEKENQDNSIINNNHDSHEPQWGRIIIAIASNEFFFEFFFDRCADNTKIVAVFAEQVSISRRFSTFLVSFPPYGPLVHHHTQTGTHSFYSLGSVTRTFKYLQRRMIIWYLHIPIQNSHYFWATGRPLIDELKIYLTISLLRRSNNASLPHEGERPRRRWFVKMFSVYSWSIVGSLAWWKLNF